MSVCGSFIWIWVMGKYRLRVLKKKWERTKNAVLNHLKFMKMKKKKITKPTTKCLNAWKLTHSKYQRILPTARLRINISYTIYNIYDTSILNNVLMCNKDYLYFIFFILPADSWQTYSHYQTDELQIFPSLSGLKLKHKEPKWLNTCLYVYFVKESCQTLINDFKQDFKDFVFIKWYFASSYSNLLYGSWRKRQKIKIWIVQY